jgi:HEAT repeat protein
MFSDPDPGVVRQAILTTGNLRDQQSIPRLLWVLASSADPDLRTPIVRILGHLASLAAFDALVTETTAADAFTRLEAARALGELADHRARHALKALLTDTTKPQRHDHAGRLRSKSTQSVGQIAAEALRKLPSPPPRPATALTTIAITQPATARTHAGRPAACQPAFSQRAGRTRLSVRRQQRAAPGREGAPGRRVPGDHLSGAGRLARCSG